MKKIIHLDCTLRDGGYYTNWNFDRQLVNDYLNALDKINVDFVEIGFRFLDKNKTKGEFAYTSEKLINKLEIPKNLIDNEVKSLPNTPETKDKDNEVFYAIWF